MLSKRAFTILSFSLVVGLALLVIVSNRDRTQVLYERLDPNTVVTSDLPNLLYTNSLQSQNPHSNFFSFFEKSGTFECLNGKDPAKLSQKEQLLEFIQGPCLPVVAVPGLLGSRLSVRIDCETFQANNPDIFKACGWDTCSWWKLWGSMPSEEYLLWISDFIGPVSIIFDSTVRCWGNIIQLEYNTSEPDITKKYRSPIGANVTVYREKEASNSKCGFEAVNNIVPGPYQTLYSKGYDGIHRNLVDMGYQPGLTLFAAPYDWRKTTMANGITDVLNQTVRQNYALTGKPTVIMAHSLGNFGTLHLLNSLSAEEKEKFIANYVSITNPLAGSPKAVKTFVGGDKDYVYKKFGVNFYAQKKLISDSSGAFDVLPKDPYRLFANSPWLQEWKTRADLENKYDVRTKEGKKIWENTIAKGNYTYKWFPHPLLNCSYGFEQRRDECGLYMYNWSEIPIATVMNKTYAANEEDLDAFFDEYALATNVSDQLFDDTRTNFIYKLNNPEVPVTLIYGSHLSTEMAYKWDYDPRINARQDKFAFPNVTLYTQGDQTVPTSSALLPALKWSWEFDNKKKSGVSNAKPIKTVEICSIHNNRGNIYDHKPDNGPYSILQNEYIGLDCDCFNQKNDHPVLGQSCDHGDILNDSKLIKFITEIVNANHRISNTTNLIVHKISDQDLKLISQSCPHVNANVTIFDQILKNVTSQAHLRPGIHKFITD